MRCSSDEKGYCKWIPKLKDFYDIANDILEYNILEIISNQNSDK